MFLPQTVSRAATYNLSRLKYMLDYRYESAFLKLVSYLLYKIHEMDECP